MSEIDVLNSLNGATRLYAIIGDPIAQVKSPAGVTRMFNERGLDAVVVPIHVAPEHVDQFIRTAGLLKNFDGIIVTIPHKIAAYAHCATVTDRAEIVGTVNVLRRNPDNSWHGDMFDGLGMINGIRAQGGEPRGKKALLIGVGGAGTAIAQGLLEEAVNELAIFDRDEHRLDQIVAQLQNHYGDRVRKGTNNPSGFELIVNATPMGMKPEHPFPVDVEYLSPDAFVACAITAPAVSPWIAAARAKGCKSSVGIDMFNCVMTLMVDFFLDPSI